MTLKHHPTFQLVERFVNRILDVGRGEVDGEPCPLFAGVVDVDTGRVLTAMTAAPPAIRVADFNWCGNNMMHDILLLEVLDALTPLTGDARYAQATDDALRYYANHCPHPETGLFPWGEHAQ